MIDCFTAVRLSSSWPLGRKSILGWHRWFASVGRFTWLWKFVLDNDSRWCFGSLDVVQGSLRQFYQLYCAILARGGSKSQLTIAVLKKKEDHGHLEYLFTNKKLDNPLDPDLPCQETQESPTVNNLVISRYKCTGPS